MNPRKRRLVRSVMNSYASTEKEFHDYVKGQVTHQQEEKTKSKEKDLLEREAQKKKSQMDPVGHGDAQDVFVMADGKEDIARIQDMNDMRGKVVSEQRHRVVEKEGRIKHEDLPDVRRDMNMQANQMQAQKKG